MSLAAKGQLTSEGNFAIFKSPKKQTFFKKNFCPMRLGQKSFKKKVHFLGDLNSPNFHSKINWPLVILQHRKHQHSESLESSTILSSLVVTVELRLQRLRGCFNKVRLTSSHQPQASSTDVAKGFQIGSHSLLAALSTAAASSHLVSNG